MTYKQALAEQKRVGVGCCVGEAELAGLCSTLQFKLGAVSPKLIFEGAQKRKISAAKLWRMVKHDPEAVVDLQWE